MRLNCLYLPPNTSSIHIVSYYWVNFPFIELTTICYSNVADLLTSFKRNEFVKIIIRPFVFKSIYGRCCIRDFHANIRSIYLGYL